MTGIRSKRPFQWLIRIVWFGVFLALSPLLLFALLYAITPCVKHLSEENPASSAYMELYCSQAKCTNTWIQFDDISNVLKESIINIEDPGFFTHDGFRLAGIRHAISLNLEAGAYVKGASSISQQTARNLFLYSDKTMWRKLKEAVITLKLESHLSKERILEIYLNIIEFGPNTFGIQHASKYHFDKHPSDLTLKDSAALIAIVPYPRKSAPIDSGSTPPQRMSEILQRLLALKHPAASNKAINDTLHCEQFLDKTDNALIDSILDKTYLLFAHKIASGDAAFLSYQGFVANLSGEEANLMNNIMSSESVNLSQKALFEASLKEDNFVSINTENEFGLKRFWLPRSVYSDYEKMKLTAKQQGLEFQLTSAYRGAGYQAYLALQIIKRVNYCLSTAFNIVEKPFMSEHGEFVSTALDFKTPHHRGIKFQHSRAYAWLLENAQRYNFYLSYPPNNKKGKNFEPWHWRHSIQTN